MAPNQAIGDYDIYIVGISLVAILVFTLYVLKQFHVEHVGVLLLILVGESLAFVFANEYIPKTTALVVKSLGLAASASVGFTGLKNTIFKKSEVPIEIPKEKPKLPDKLF